MLALREPACCRAVAKGWHARSSLLTCSRTSKLPGDPALTSSGTRSISSSSLRQKRAAASTSIVGHNLRKKKQRLFVAGVNPFLPPRARTYLNPSFAEVDLSEWLSSLNFGPAVASDGGGEGLEITNIASGLDHTLIAFRTEQEDAKGRKQLEESIFAIGRNEAGQLGIGYNSQEPTRGLVEGFSGDFIEGLACGITSTFVQVKQEDQSVLYACGNRSRGQLGLPPAARKHGEDSSQMLTSRATLVSPPDVSVAQVAAGFEHVLILSDDGQLYGTGVNTDGQLGIGDDEDRHSFSKIDLPEELSSDGIASIVAGADTSAVLTRAGNLWTFGNSEYAQAFHGEKIDRVLRPKQVPLDFLSGSRVQDFRIAGSSAILLDDRGLVHTAGFGAIGQGQDQLESIRPRQLPGLEGILGIYAGCGYATALNDRQELLIFGLNNAAGRLGISTTENLCDPQKLQLRPLAGISYTVEAFVHSNNTTFLLVRELQG